jgi:hypothetical protein
LKDPAAIDRVRSLAAPIDVPLDVDGALSAIARARESRNA